ncbi:MAG: FkbM family methyltransferase [Bryobacterales bacterium]|nr:FkbM family methyltransferase [Bryobacterales bacterium]
MQRAVKASIRRLLPKRYTAHHIISGPLQGLRIVTSWNDYPSAILGYNEKALLHWFGSNARTGETWLDIGSHYGYTAMAMARLVGETGRVFAFEPMLSTAGCISRSIAINRLRQVTIVPMALGSPSEMEIRRISTVRGMADSTLNGGQNEAAIFVASFEWLWPRICGGDSHIDGVKIDVQGMEIEVVRGMTTTLKLWRPKLALEVHAGVDREVLLALLEGCGYTRNATPIEPVAGETSAQYLENRSYEFHAN